MIIYYHPRFQKSFKRLDRQLRMEAEKKIALFRADPFSLRLDTHRLRGRLKNQWSFCVDKRYRVLFEFFDAEYNEVVFLDIGNHNIYR